MDYKFNFFSFFLDEEMGEEAWMGHQRRPSLKQTPPGMREWEGIRIGKGWE